MNTRSASGARAASSTVSNSARVHSEKPALSRPASSCVRRNCNSAASALGRIARLFSHCSGRTALTMSSAPGMPKRKPQGTMAPGTT